MSIATALSRAPLSLKRRQNSRSAWLPRPWSTQMMRPLSRSMTSVMYCSNVDTAQSFEFRWSAAVMSLYPSISRYTQLSPPGSRSSLSNGPPWPRFDHHVLLSTRFFNPVSGKVPNRPRGDFLSAYLARAPADKPANGRDTSISEDQP